MPKILVTGGTGFIGTHLVEALSIEHSVIALGSPQGDIASRDTWESLEKENISRVFHLASRSFVPDSWINPEAYYRTNVLGTVNALQFCRVREIPMTYLSSYVYGTPDILPINEQAPLKANNPYAQSKIFAEQVCQFYVKNFNVSVTILRPFNVYGPGQSEDFLIPKIIQQVLGETEINLNDLNPKRDFIYIEDLISALIKTLNSKRDGIYNIGYGKSWSVKEIVDITQKISGTSKLVISKNLQRQHEIVDVVADVSSAEKDLGWKPKIDIEEGLRKTISSYKNVQVNQVGY